MTREPEPISSILPRTILRLRTLEEIRANRIARAAAAFEQAVRDCREVAR